MKVIVQTNNNVNSEEKIKEFKKFNIGTVSTTIANLLNATYIQIDENEIPVIELIDAGTTKLFLINNLNNEDNSGDYQVVISESDLIQINGGGSGTSDWTKVGNNIYNNNSGNIGFGHTNPLYKYDFRLGTNSRVAFLENAGEALITYFNPTTFGANNYKVSAVDHIFLSNAVEKFRINTTVNTSAVPLRYGSALALNNDNDLVYKKYIVDYIPTKVKRGVFTYSAVSEHIFNVTLANTEPDVDYTVLITPNDSTTISGGAFWVPIADKGVNSFVVECTNNITGDINFDYVVIRN